MHYKQLLSLAEAEQLGFGKADTLKHAIHNRKLRGVKIGRNWSTSKIWLEQAGYKKRD